MTDRLVQDLVDEARLIAALLPRSHIKCATSADPELGICNCGYEQAKSLREKLDKFDKDYTAKSDGLVRLHKIERIAYLIRNELKLRAGAVNVALEAELDDVLAPELRSKRSDSTIESAFEWLSRDSSRLEDVRGVMDNEHMSLYEAIVWLRDGK